MSEEHSQAEQLVKTEDYRASAQPDSSEPSAARQAELAAA